MFASKTLDDCKQLQLWLTVLAFGRVADEPRHSAGDPVSVSGRLQLSRYVTNDGEAREGWQVIADSVVSSRSVRPGGGRRKGDGGEVRDRRERSPGEPFDDALSF